MKELEFKHVLVLLACVIAITVMQSLTGIDGSLTAVVMLLMGVITGWFGKEYLEQRKQTVQEGEQEVPVGDGWRR